MPLPELPGFIAHASTHYLFHIRPDSLAEHELTEIITGQEAVFVRITGTLGVTLSFPLHCILTDNQRTWDFSMAMASPARLHHRA